MLVVAVAGACVFRLTNTGWLGTSSNHRLGKERRGGERGRGRACGPVVGVRERVMLNEALAAVRSRLTPAPPPLRYLVPRYRRLLPCPAQPPHPSSTTKPVRHSSTSTSTTKHHHSCFLLTELRSFSPPFPDPPFPSALLPSSRPCKPLLFIETTLVCLDHQTSPPLCLANSRCFRSHLIHDHLNSNQYHHPTHRRQYRHHYRTKDGYDGATPAPRYNPATRASSAAATAADHRWLGLGRGQVC